MTPDDLPATFRRHIEEIEGTLPTPCWRWAGVLDRYGYARFWRSKMRKWVRGHRFAYEHLLGAIPEGDTLDHLCHMRSCVRPDHCEPVSRSINSTRANEYRWHGTTHHKEQDP